MTAFVTTPTLGINLAATTAGTTTAGEGAAFTLGTQVTGNDGSVWMYVQASGAISQYSYCCIDTAFQCYIGTKALVDQGMEIAIAQVAFADNDFGWVLIKGTGAQYKVNVLISCTASVLLSTTATPGFLDDTAATATQTTILGLQLQTSATASGGYSMIANFPNRAQGGLAWTY